MALPNGGNFDYNSIKTVAASGNVKASYTNKQEKQATPRLKNHLQRQNRRNHPDGRPGHRHSGRHREKPNKDAFIRCTPTETCTAAGTKTTFRHVDKKLSDRKTRKPAANREFVLLFSLLSAEGICKPTKRGPLWTRSA
ncbi:MAG: hypothetical protein ACLSUW_05480 [Akkermansia sp.]